MKAIVSKHLVSEGSGTESEPNRKPRQGDHGELSRNREVLGGGWKAPEMSRTFTISACLDNMPIPVLLAWDGRRSRPRALRAWVASLYPWSLLRQAEAEETRLSGEFTLYGDCLC